jgi:hypothetical protein
MSDDLSTKNLFGPAFDRLVQLSQERLRFRAEVLHLGCGKLVG